MRLRVLLAVLTVSLATAGGALAQTIQDPADTHGKLDLRSATFSEHGATLSFAITTWRPWSTAGLYSRRVSREVCALIWTRSATSRTYDFSVCADLIAGQRKLVGSVFENGREEAPVSVGRAALTRPDTTTLTLSFPARLIDSPRALRWQIRSFYTRFDFTSIARERL
jgi:hypothetical protein